MNASGRRQETDAHEPSGASTRTVASYAAAVAADTAAPGGGSVAGVVGALAAALTEMVCHLSAGRAAGLETDAELATTMERASTLRARLLALAGDDEAAYSGYVAATRLPKRTDAEKSDRHAALQRALGTAADVPFAIATACQQTLDGLEPLAAGGNKHLVSDVIVAALCAEVAARAALLNVEVNARLMTDKGRGQTYRQNAADLEQTVRDRAATIITTATARL
ncbi:MAG TPA: cyclodeaminase/cyclohydrolase family protein [Thermomicrobiales bacterium]|nr:cyclodeaminase/cyclohydrolase family protein [Thermomicrobiales bacterium]